jgi:hypothetical protein
MGVTLGDRMTSFLQTGSMKFLIETKLGGRLASYPREPNDSSILIAESYASYINGTLGDIPLQREIAVLKYALDVCIGMSYSGHSLSEVQTLQWNGSSFPRLTEDSTNDIISTQQVITFDF